MVLSVLIGTLICLPVLPKGVIRVKELPLPLQPTFFPGHLSQQGCPLGQGQGWRGGVPSALQEVPSQRTGTGAGLAAGKDLPGEGPQGAMALACATRVSRGWPSREEWEGSVVGTSPGMGVETCTPHLPLHQPVLASAKVPPGLDEWSLGLPAFLEGSPAPHPHLLPSTHNGEWKPNRLWQ